MKPPFAYYGGKARLAPWIVSLMPPHSIYTEPCLGGGAVFFAKPPVEHEIVNDIDGALVTFFRALREQPDELIRLCEATPYARAELAASDPDEDGLSDLEVARRWWVCVNQSFNKTGRHKNGFAASAAAGAGEAKTTKRRLERLNAVAERLRDAVIECRPAVDVVTTYDTSRTLHYLDLPYVKTTRTNNSTAYRNEMSDDDHREVAKACNEAKGVVMVSGYRSDLYDEIFAGWHTIETQIIKRTSNRHRDKRESSTEVIWSNRPLDEGRLAI